MVLAGTASHQLNPKGAGLRIGPLLLPGALVMIDTIDNSEVAAIRQLNDSLRQTGAGGRTMLTPGVAALPADALSAILRGVVAFDAFTPDNDPHGEHDCASFDVRGHRVMWKIDYYAPDLDHHSDNPADPSITRRVLTVMLAEEY